MTSAASSASTPTNMPKAVSSDCENRKWLSSAKKPRKKITKASRRALSSSVLSVSSSRISALPASRPRRERNCAAVNASDNNNKPALIQREGRGFCFRVSQARQLSTIRPNTVVDQGIWADCISTIHPITASRNNVSRLSRGSAPSQGRLRNQSRGEELAGSVFMRALRSGAAVDQGHW